MPPWGSMSRRDALTAIGGGIATVSASRIATGRPGATLAGRDRVTVGISGSAAERAVRDHAHEVVHEFAFDALTVVLDEPDAEALRRLDDVRYVERDGRYEIAAQTTPWGIDRVDAEVGHARGETGDGSDVAIIDTGIDRSHEDLAANLGEGAAFTGPARHDQWQDDNGHGTHCAGIVAAVGDDAGVVGVAPRATLHAVKVMTSPGAGLSSDVAKGIEWVADQGYDVGSLSLRGDRLQSVADACEYAHDQGVTLVAAAGNAGPCRDCVTYPAAYPQVIAVSATTKDDGLADFSSRGPEVELAAPGEQIRSTYLGGYATRSGTSMACPHVSGAAAHLAARGHSNEAIRRTLRESAEDVGLSANEAGAGLLDVAAAVGVDSSDDRRASGSGSASTETGTETPATNSSDAGARGDAGGGGGGSSSSSTPPTTASGTPQQSTGTTRSSTPTAEQSGTATGSHAATPTSSATSSGGPADAVASLWDRVSDAVGVVVDAVVDALAVHPP